MKRHEFIWKPGGHHSHDDCNCDLYVNFPSLGLDPIIERRYVGHKRSVRDMYANVKALIASSYVMSQGLVVRKAFDVITYENYLREYNTPSSQISVTPPFPISNRVKECDIVPCVKWRELARSVESNYWAKFGIYEREQDPDAAIPTLFSMCKKRLSWEDTVFGTMNGKKRTIHTMSYFPLEKQMALYAEFNVDTMYRGASEEHMWTYTSGALNWMNFQMDVYKNHNSLKFDYDPHKLIKKVRLFTSAGIAAGGTAEGTIDGEEVRVVSSGKKIHLIEAAMRKVHKLLTGIRKHDPSVYESIIAVIKTKYEWKFGQFKSEEDLTKMLLKMREFFIPDLPHSFIGILLNEARSLLERNNIIRIGMRFWNGGCWYLFLYLNGNMPNMIWVDGDIEGLDKHIMDWMLLLYCHNVYPYYKWDDMSEPDREFLYELLALWAANVCSKLVCHVGSFWRFMVGQMYSGGKETSHGGSWIMAFIFFCYCEHVKSRNPSRSRLIDEFLSMMIITIVVYGDDHIWCAPEMLSDIMNHETWRDFLKDYCRMKLRDANIYRSLLSVPDKTGRLSVVGPKFLKRYFIKNEKWPELAPILPYKLIDEQICRLFATDTPVCAELVMSAVGFAWDTQATNEYAYQVITDFYNKLASVDQRTPAEILKDIDLTSVDKTRLRRLIRKIGLSTEDIFDHYPSLNEMLDRHKPDPLKASHFVSLEQLSSIGEEYELEVEEESEY